MVRGPQQERKGQNGLQPTGQIPARVHTFPASSEPARQKPARLHHHRQKQRQEEKSSDTPPTFGGQGQHTRWDDTKTNTGQILAQVPLWIAQVTLNIVKNDGHTRPLQAVINLSKSKTPDHSYLSHSNHSLFIQS